MISRVEHLVRLARRIHLLIRKLHGGNNLFDWKIVFLIGHNLCDCEMERISSVIRAILPKDTLLTCCRVIQRETATHGGVLAEVCVLCLCNSTGLTPSGCLIVPTAIPSSIPLLHGPNWRKQQRSAACSPKIYRVHPQDHY